MPVGPAILRVKLGDPCKFQDLEGFRHQLAEDGYAVPAQGLLQGFVQAVTVQGNRPGQRPGKERRQDFLVLVRWQRIPIIKRRIELAVRASFPGPQDFQRCPGAVCEAYGQILVDFISGHVSNPHD
jgi:hypothetical protein